MRIAKRLLKTIALLVAIVVAIPVVGLAYGFATTDGAKVVPLPKAQEEKAPQGVRETFAGAVEPWLRREENTFLTYPEWSIVYAARDYAHLLENGRESGFAYFAYAARYWQDYARVVRATSDYPFNGEYHTMLVVIGTSQTIEYLLQGLWENTIGRLTEALSGTPTPQDRLRAEAARDYAAMLDSVPWYEFDYRGTRAELWGSPVAPGIAAIRSWERKLAFGLSDSIKAVYADLIKSGLQATSGTTELDIAVWAAGPVAEAIAGEADTRLFRDLGENGAVFITRRYQVFTEMVPRLVARGVRFIEIAGNDEMLVTILSAGPVVPPADARLFFSDKIPARRGTWRTAIVVPVRSLHEIVPLLARDGMAIEHLYDY